MLLPKIPDGNFVAPTYGAALYAKMAFAFIDKSGRVANQRTNQRGLPRSVSSKQSNLFAAFEIGRKSVDDLQIAVIFLHRLKFQRMPAGRLFHHKIDIRT